MANLSPLLLAALLSVAGEGAKPLDVSGCVAGDDDRPAGGVVVLVSGTGETRPVLARTRTGDDGRFRLTVPAEADPDLVNLPLAVWAHRPGRGLVGAGLSRQKPPAEGSVSLKLGFHAHVDLRVLGPDGAPVGGAVVAPLTLRIVGGLGPNSIFPLPDEVAARLAVRTDAEGDGRMADVTPGAVLAVRVDAQAFGLQTLATPADGQGATTLKLAATGRLAGRVITDDPKAAAGRTVFAYTRPDTGRPGSVSGAAVAVTDSGGRFAVPALAVGRLTLRLVLSKDSGQSPAPPIGREVEPGKLTEVEIPLRGPARLRTLAGRVVDRKGGAVAGAVVFQSGDAPARTRRETDPDGRFRLPGAAEGPTFVFARADGFRFAGRPVAPGDADLTLTLTREGETPDPPTATLPPPLPPAEERDLARKVLEPYAVRVLKDGGDSEKIPLLEVMARTDPARVLELIETKAVREPFLVHMMRMRVATGLLADAPDEALAVTESIDDPGFRAMGLIEASDALPGTERAKKLDLLARAVVDAKASKDPTLRLLMTGQVAERWLDLGEKARGEALLRAGQADAEAMPSAAFAGYARGAFAAELAQIDLKAALALTANLSDPREFDRHHGNVAHEVAALDPSEAERVLGMVRDAFQRDQYSVRVVYRMARADLPRARRLAGAVKDEMLRGYALGMIALGLAEADRRVDAAKILGEAFDSLGKSAEANPARASGMYNPAAVAAVLIPVAERVDPRLVPECFWRALSFRSPAPSAKSFDWLQGADVQLAAAVARYDRGVARSLLDPLVGPGAPASVRLGLRGLPDAAAALIDPRRAVGLVEALPDDPDLKPHETKNAARMAVAKVLSRPGAKRWRYLTYQYLHLWVPDVEDIDPNL